MKKELLISGKICNIFALSIHGKCQFAEFLKKRGKSEKAQLVARLNRFADNGIPLNVEQFKPLKETENRLFEVRCMSGARVISFIEDVEDHPICSPVHARSLILVRAMMKLKPRRFQGEIAKSLSLYNNYYGNDQEG